VVDRVEQICRFGEPRPPTTLPTAAQRGHGVAIPAALLRSRLAFATPLLGLGRCSMAANTPIVGSSSELRAQSEEEQRPMPELMVDFITSLDGYGAAEGWPGWWGLQGPEYLSWLAEQPERHHTILMGATTYRQMSGFSTQIAAAEVDLTSEEAASIEELSNASKVVFSSTLQEPLALPNTRLVGGDPVETVRAMKRAESTPMRTIGSLTLCRSLLEAGLVDRFRVAVFPVITGRTGSDRIYDGYPDVALELVASRTMDGRIQLLEYVPTILSGPPA
jgi:dihydrofolate reductase